MVGPPDSTEFPPLPAIEQQTDDAIIQLAQALGVITDRASTNTALRNIKKFLADPTNVDIYVVSWLKTFIRDHRLAPPGGLKADLMNCIRGAGREVQSNIISRQQEVMNEWVEEYQVEWSTAGNLTNRRLGRRVANNALEDSGLTGPEYTATTNQAPQTSQPGPQSRSYSPAQVSTSSVSTNHVGNDEGGGQVRITDTTPSTGSRNIRNVMDDTPPPQAPLTRATTSQNHSNIPQPAATNGEVEARFVLVTNNQAALPNGPVAVPQASRTDREETGENDVPNNPTSVALSTNPSGPADAGQQNLPAPETTNVRPEMLNPNRLPPDTTTAASAELSDMPPIRVTLTAPAPNTPETLPGDADLVANITLHGEDIVMKAFERAAVKFTELWRAEIFPVVMEEMARELSKSSKMERHI